MNETHPDWCSLKSCSAYSSELTDLLYHRSEPVVVPTDDDNIKIYIYRTADVDGGIEYVDLIELEGPITLPWYLNEPRGKGSAELCMPIAVAGQIQSALAVLAHL